ncbi:DUF427 domain-containing protein [Halieaceae bacterium IMCC14734]|uniref:DUF427 domain-containing protein n=1 Tax=Candidatus Litorirhabdus singularis TaxID=2518993 RepID=A0ABT3TDV9_9GAMM|nr:DUF427 domain-containing protein [Candidatus Litorirhabdus singularis]MCX2980500.1 DUF427 domain-containing protein [Candidatus Litorirhabdus singularis]
MWKYTGSERPAFAEEPKPGQESVWDYPRPPALVTCTNDILVGDAGQVVAHTTQALRVLETASPPTYYLPPDAVDWNLLEKLDQHSWCEWKGEATYWGLATDKAAGAVGWSYHAPHHTFAAIDGFMSFYPGRIACYIDGEQVKAQAGGFYGGWVTKNIVGPMKGDPGTGHW